MGSDYSGEQQNYKYSNTDSNISWYAYFNNKNQGQKG